MRESRVGAKQFGRWSADLAALFLTAVLSSPLFAQGMSLPGKFGVATSGTAVYKIPIAVPPGTGGMKPSLSLNYDSQSGVRGSGIVGVGWSIGGLPSIGRCRRTSSQDGALGSVNFDADDRFCLDGQRLVAISGTYGADGTEYRTEIESFLRVISHGAAGTGPAWFEARGKSGQILQFGNTTDSRILAHGKSTARSWAVNKVSDTKGNYYTVSYINDTANGQAYPTEINYTGNAAAGVSPYNKVQFVYSDMPDVTPVYQAGSLSVTTVRLTNVRTYDGASIVGDYRLTYQLSAGTNRSLLSNIILCDAGGVCLPQTSFSWTAGDDVTFSTKPYVELFAAGAGYGVSTGWSPSWFDVNGDGIADLVLTYQGSALGVQIALSNGDGTFTVKPYVELFPAGSGYGVSTGWSPSWFDVNGDGKADLVLTYQDSALGARIALSNGDGTFAVKPYVELFPAGAGYGVSSGWRPSWVDVDGDGKTDLVLTYQAESNGALDVRVALSNGDGAFTLKPTAVLFPAGSGYVPSVWHASWADANGDGKADLVLTYQDQGNGALDALVALSNGDGAFTVKPTANLFPAGSGYVPSVWHASWADANGDGKADLVLTYQDQSNGALDALVALSNGDGAFTVKPTANLFSAGSGYVPSVWHPSWVDANGDGRADLVLTYQDSALGVQIALSNGDGSFATKPYVALFAAGTGYGVSTGWIPSWADANGDGKADLVLTYQSSALGAKIISTSAVPLAIQGIAPGLGAMTSLTYAPLSVGGVLYTKDTDAVYPSVDVQGPIYVVSRIDKSDGVGGTYSTTYSYEGAKADLSGRGFLGFREIRATDLQTGLVETTSFLQSFPYIGMVASSTKVLSSLTLSQATTTFQFKNAANGTTVSTPSLTSAPYRVSVAQSVASRSDLDGTAMPTTTNTFQYDSYGNTTQVAVSNSDGHSKTTNNTFTNDTTNWLLGRLTTSSVAAQSP